MPVGAARAVTLPPSLARGAVTRETAAELMRAAMFASRRRRASARWRVPVTADAAVMPRHPRTAASKRPRKNQDFDSGRLPGIGKSALLIGRALSDWAPYRSTDVDSAKARRPGPSRGVPVRGEGITRAGSPAGGTARRRSARGVASTRAPRELSASWTGDGRRDARRPRRESAEPAIGDRPLGVGFLPSVSGVTHRDPPPGVLRRRARAFLVERPRDRSHP